MRDFVLSFAGLSFIITMIAYIPYVIGVWKSEAKLTISTWISWGLMDAAILASMIASNEIAWQMAGYVCGAIIMVLVSLSRGASVGWKNIDSVFLGVVVLAIIGWALTGNPEVAIVFSLIAITGGTIPMLVNVWKDPSDELLLPWVLFALGGLAGVLAINNWTIVGASAQVVFLAIQSGFAALIARKFRGQPLAKWRDQVLLRD